MESIISALIAGGLALVGVVITSISSNKRIENQLMTAQAVTDTKLENITTEVHELKKISNITTQIPVIEQRVTVLERDVKELKRA